MALIQWQTSLSVGIPAIDAQHKHLIDLINQLHEGMRNGQGNDVLGNILDRLVSYTETHFRTEERLMASSKFSGLQQHRDEHEKLAQQVKKLAADFHARRVGLSLEVLRFLKEWLQQHIMGSDQQYAATVRDSRIAVLAH